MDKPQEVDRDAQTDSGNTRAAAREPSDIPADGGGVGQTRETAPADTGITSESLPMSSGDAVPPSTPASATRAAALDPDAGMEVTEESQWRREHRVKREP